ncbi:glutathione S-transferase family protein [Wenxinia marina]|uniref:Glutathione S-transferase n=1 Tax=Wenxinia marina DSM 24838 TaxID=1123501 RepID=A0A0D0QG05_9RHOB|nr:glutathione S-transferase family protein [Wenxinia marina]KIQ71177.1 Glutathione S-transferase [Wenxinia marina DSM 24838]GGL81822.1 glutathione S-transferase [Wenxinia marina]
MQLVSSPASPFVRKVRVLIREAGHEADVTETPVATTPLAPAADALAANPTGKIPALIRDDGPAIYDSRVICRYLDSTWSAGLYPEKRLWEVLTLEATADAILDAAVLVVYEGRFREAPLQSWIDAQWAKVTRGLAAIEARWMSHLSGPLDMSQIAVGCALGYLDFRHGERGWRGAVPELAAWGDRFAERPAMQATAPV